MSLTTDISKMNISEVTDMLRAYQEEKTTNLFKSSWYDEGTQPTLNEESGYCFLTNEDYQVSMLHNETLSMFLNCGECGNEDLEQDFRVQGTCDGCKELYQQIKESNQWLRLNLLLQILKQ